MKICLVTAFPPSREALNEYGFHIARELQVIPELDVTIMADDYPGDEPELEGFSVVRCWRFNSLQNPARLLRAIRKVQPDVVWFNLGFASFGGKPLPAFVGIGTPALVRMAGFYTHITLHQLMETVDLKDAGIRFPRIYKSAGFLATQLVLFANSVSVLLPAYRSIIREKYRRGSVYVRQHGILSGRPEYPDFAKRGNPVHRILALGKWGTYKRLEPLLEAFETVCAKVPNVELVIAGTDHPKAPGYLASVEAACGTRPKIRFAGYIGEDKIGELFQSTSIAVMPYTSSAGSSGVAHLACAYGVPIVASDIQDFRQLANEEGLAIQFFETGNVESLANSLIEVLENPERQPEMAIQNFSAALRMSMPEVIRQYLRTFDLQRHMDLLLSVARVRRLPRWFPLRKRMMRAATRRRLSQLSAAPHLSDDPVERSFDGQWNHQSETLIPGLSMDVEANPLPGARSTDRNSRGYAIPSKNNQRDETGQHDFPEPLLHKTPSANGKSPFFQHQDPSAGTVVPAWEIASVQGFGNGVEGDDQVNIRGVAVWNDTRRGKGSEDPVPGIDSDQE
jgi:glycosyltransferase involved in cell wall biosynthesis